VAELWRDGIQVESFDGDHHQRPGRRAVLDDGRIHRDGRSAVAFRRGPPHLRSNGRAMRR